MDKGFDLLFDDLMNGGLQHSPCCQNPPQQTQELESIVVQLTQEGLTISCSKGFQITLPPQVAVAVKTFFEQMKPQGETNG